MTTQQLPAAFSPAEHGEQLCRYLLGAASNPDPTNSLLAGMETVPGYSATLAHLAMDAQRPAPERLVAAIAIRNVVRRHWGSGHGPAPSPTAAAAGAAAQVPPAPERSLVRQALSKLCVEEADRRVRSVAAAALAKICRVEWLREREWPFVVTYLFKVCAGPATGQLRSALEGEHYADLHPGSFSAQEATLARVMTCTHGLLLELETKRLAADRRRFSAFCDSILGEVLMIWCTQLAVLRYRNAGALMAMAGAAARAAGGPSSGGTPRRPAPRPASSPDYAPPLSASARALGMTTRVMGQCLAHCSHGALLGATGLQLQGNVVAALPLLLSLLREQTCLCAACSGGAGGPLAFSPGGRDSDSEGSEGGGGDAGSDPEEDEAEQGGSAPSPSSGCDPVTVALGTLLQRTVELACVAARVHALALASSGCSPALARLFAEVVLTSAASVRDRGAGAATGGVPGSGGACPVHGTQPRPLLRQHAPSFQLPAAAALVHGYAPDPRVEGPVLHNGTLRYMLLFLSQTVDAASLLAPVAGLLQARGPGPQGLGPSPSGGSARSSVLDSVEEPDKGAADPAAAGPPPAAYRDAGALAVLRTAGELFGAQMQDRWLEAVLLSLLPLLPREVREWGQDSEGWALAAASETRGETLRSAADTLLLSLVSEEALAVSVCGRVLQFAGRCEAELFAAAAEAAAAAGTGGQLRGSPTPSAAAYSPAAAVLCAALLRLEAAYTGVGLCAADSIARGVLTQGAFVGWVLGQAATLARVLALCGQPQLLTQAAAQQASAAGPASPAPIAAPPGSGTYLAATLLLRRCMWVLSCCLGLVPAQGPALPALLGLCFAVIGGRNGLGAPAAGGDSFNSSSGGSGGPSLPVGARLAATEFAAGLLEATPYGDAALLPAPMVAMAAQCVFAGVASCSDGDCALQMLSLLSTVLGLVRPRELMGAADAVIGPLPALWAAGGQNGNFHIKQHVLSLLGLVVKAAGSEGGAGAGGEGGRGQPLTPSLPAPLLAGLLPLISGSLEGPDSLYLGSDALDLWETLLEALGGRDKAACEPLCALLPLLERLACCPVPGPGAPAMASAASDPENAAPLARITQAYLDCGPVPLAMLLGPSSCGGPDPGACMLDRTLGGLLEHCPARRMGPVLLAVEAGLRALLQLQQQGQGQFSGVGGGGGPGAGALAQTLALLLCGWMGGVDAGAARKEGDSRAAAAQAATRRAAAIAAAAAAAGGGAAVPAHHLPHTSSLMSTDSGSGAWNAGTGVVSWGAVGQGSTQGPLGTTFQLPPSPSAANATVLPLALFEEPESQRRVAAVLARAALLPPGATPGLPHQFLPLLGQLAGMQQCAPLWGAGPGGACAFPPGSAGTVLRAWAASAAAAAATAAPGTGPAGAAAFLSELTRDASALRLGVWLLDGWLDGVEDCGGSSGADGAVWVQSGGLTLWGNKLLLLAVLRLLPACVSLHCSLARRLPSLESLSLIPPGSAGQACQALLGTREYDPLHAPCARLEALFTLVADAVRDSAALLRAADSAALYLPGINDTPQKSVAAAAASRASGAAATGLDAPEPEEDAHLRGGRAGPSGGDALIASRVEVRVDLVLASKECLGALQEALGAAEAGARVAPRLPPQMVALLQGGPPGVG